MKLASIALAALPWLVGCAAPNAEAAPAPHCARCDTVWSKKDTDYHEWHQRELNMMMYASGCELCRHHGAYKDMEFYSGPLTFRNKDGSIDHKRSGIYAKGQKIAPLPKK